MTTSLVLLSSEWLLAPLPSSLSVPFPTLGTHRPDCSLRCLAAAESSHDRELHSLCSRSDQLPRVLDAKASVGLPRLQQQQRRQILWSAAVFAPSLLLVNALQPVLPAQAARRSARDFKVPESDFKELPSGLKVYDVTVGSGPLASKGSRVAVHYVAKWKGITFMTSRQGLGVTGGTPYGFDVGSSESGIVLKGLDQGVEGMRVGGERLLLVPPQLAYGNRGVAEIPPGATLEFSIELLSIKPDASGSRVKLVEG